MLRDYQEKQYIETQEAFKSGARRVIVESPCGSGKSYLFSKMAAESSARGEVLILSHRQELIDQHEELLTRLGVYNENVRIESVFTEVNHLGEHRKPILIIADECHLSRANSWVKCIQYYDTFVVGFTATPVRLDGKPLGDIYEKLITGPSVKHLIENKFLSPYEYYAPMSVDTDNLKTIAGDYQLNELEKLMCDRKVYSDVIHSYERLAKGEKTIAYCTSIKHSIETAQEFRAAGYSSAHIDGKTPDSERQRIISDFRGGKISVLCNVGIISEGISIDDVAACMLLRPTQSLALHIQQSMRCMRYAPGKTAKIIDCVANYTRHPLPDEDIAWSLEQSVKKPKFVNVDGTFAVRVCRNCYLTFKTAPACPYCGTEYECTGREIDSIESVELQRITEEEKQRVEQEKKRMRQEVGMARTYPELARIAKERGYKSGWIYQMMRLRGR